MNYTGVKSIIVLLILMSGIWPHSFLRTGQYRARDDVQKSWMSLDKHMNVFPEAMLLRTLFSYRDNVLDLE